jgi:hypothetical protein
MRTAYCVNIDSIRDENTLLAHCRRMRGNVLWGDVIKF